MAVPKKRRSYRRKKMRRSHQALKTKSLAKCSETDEMTLPHRISPNGFYRGELIDPRAVWAEYK